MKTTMQQARRVKAPVQFLESNGKTFLPVPLRNVPIQLRDHFSDRISELAGEGTVYRDETPESDDTQYRRHYLVILDSNSARLPGTWIIDYTLDCQDGTTINQICAASEVL